MGVSQPTDYFIISLGKNKNKKLTDFFFTALFLPFILDKDFVATFLAVLLL